MTDLMTTEEVAQMLRCSPRTVIPSIEPQVSTRALHSAQCN